MRRECRITAQGEHRITSCSRDLVRFKTEADARGRLSPMLDASDKRPTPVAGNFKVAMKRVVLIHATHPIEPVPARGIVLLIMLGSVLWLGIIEIALALL